MTLDHCAVSRVDCLLARIPLANRRQAASLVGEMRNMPRHIEWAAAARTFLLFRDQRRPTALHIKTQGLH